MISTGSPSTCVYYASSVHPLHGFRLARCKGCQGAPGARLGFADAVGIFLGRTVEWQDSRRDYSEVRMIAVGEVDSDSFTVIYTDRGETRWIITAWPSNRKERLLWR